MPFHQPVFAKALLLAVYLFTCIPGRAQTTHSIGAGAFVTAPLVSGNYSLTENEDLIIRASPFANYTLTLGRLNARVGFGIWNSTLSSELTMGANFNGSGFSSSHATLINSFNYAFSPIAVGINVVNGSRLKAGFEGYGLIKYLMLLNGDVQSDDPLFATPVTHYSGKELEHFNKLGLAGGGGLFASMEFGPLIPKLGVGYVTDFTEVYDGGLINYKFSHAYAVVSVNYIIGFRAKLEPHDRRVRW